MTQMKAERKGKINAQATTKKGEDSKLIRTSAVDLTLRMGKKNVAMHVSKIKQFGIEKLSRWREKWSSEQLLPPRKRNNLNGKMSRKNQRGEKLGLHRYHTRPAKSRIAEKRKLMDTQGIKDVTKLWHTLVKAKAKS